MAICIRFCEIGSYNLAIEQISGEGEPLCYAFLSVPTEGDVRVFSGANDPAGAPTPADVFWLYENTSEQTLWYWSSVNQNWTVLNQSAEVNFIELAGAPVLAPPVTDTLAFYEDVENEINSGRVGYSSNELYQWSPTASKWIHLKRQVLDNVFTVNPNGKANYSTIADAVLDSSVPAQSTLLISGSYGSITDEILVDRELNFVFDNCLLVRRVGSNPGGLFRVSGTGRLNLFAPNLMPTLMRSGINPCVEIEQDGEFTAKNIHIQAIAGGTPAVNVANTAVGLNTRCDLELCRIVGSVGLSVLGLVSSTLLRNRFITAGTSIENRGAAGLEDWNNAEIYFNNFSAPFGGTGAINPLGFNYFS